MGNTIDNLVYRPAEVGTAIPYRDIGLTIEDSTDIEFIGTEQMRVKLFEALASYFAETQNPNNDRTNEFLRSKYATLQEVLNTIRPVLARHGFMLTQTVYQKGELACVRTMLTHAGGGAIVYPVASYKPQKNDIQTLGAVFTYLRRFSVNAVAGIIGEPDDDGESATTKGGASKKVDADSPVGKLIGVCAEKAKINRELVLTTIAKFTPKGSNIVHDVPVEKIDTLIKELNKIK